MIRPQRKCTDTQRRTKLHCLSWVSKKLSLFRLRNRKRRRKTSSSVCFSVLSHCLSEERTKRRGGESVSRHAIPALPAARAVQITRECQRFDRLPTLYSLSSPPLTARFKALFVLISKFVFLEWETTERKRMFHGLVREGADEKLFYCTSLPVIWGENYFGNTQG